MKCPFKLTLCLKSFIFSIGLLIIGLYSIDYVYFFLFLNIDAPYVEEPIDPFLVPLKLINHNFSIYNVTESINIRLNHYSPTFHTNYKTPHLVGIGMEKSGSTSIGGMVVQSKMFICKTKTPKRTELRYWIDKRCNFKVNDSFNQLLNKMGYSNYNLKQYLNDNNININNNNNLTIKEILLQIDKNFNYYGINLNNNELNNSLNGIQTYFNNDSYKLHFQNLKSINYWNQIISIKNIKSISPCNLQEYYKREGWGRNSGNQVNKPKFEKSPGIN